MKRFVIFALLVLVLSGCATKGGSSGTRSNSSDLEKSPCAGCFGDEEKQEMGVKVTHVS